MRSCLLTTLCTASIAAQTTGVPGINDLDVNGFGAGSTSCASTCYPNGGVTLNYSASVPAGAFVLVFFTFCPCSPCQLSGPTNTCAPAIPLTACGPSNQSLDMSLNAACGPLLSLPMSINSAGVLGLSINVPNFTGLPCTNAVLTAQAVVLDPCGLGLFAAPGPFVFTQAITTWF
jgi:hypothetical protein